MADKRQEPLETTPFGHECYYPPGKKKRITKRPTKVTVPQPVDQKIEVPTAPGSACEAPKSKARNRKRANGVSSEEPDTQIGNELASASPSADDDACSNQSNTGGHSPNKSGDNTNLAAGLGETAETALLDGQIKDPAAEAEGYDTTLQQESSGDLALENPNTGNIISDMAIEPQGVVVQNLRETATF